MSDHKFKKVPSVTSDLVTNLDELVLQLYQLMVYGPLENNLCSLLKKIAIRLQVQLRMYFNQSTQEYKFSYLMKARVNWLHLNNMVSMISALHGLSDEKWSTIQKLIQEIGQSIQITLNQLSDKMHASRNTKKEALAKVYYLDDTAENNLSDHDVSMSLKQCSDQVEEDYYVYADDAVKSRNTNLGRISKL